MKEATDLEIIIEPETRYVYALEALYQKYIYETSNLSRKIVNYIPGINAIAKNWDKGLAEEKVKEGYTEKEYTFVTIFDKHELIGFAKLEFLTENEAGILDLYLNKEYRKDYDMRLNPILEQLHRKIEYYFIQKKIKCSFIDIPYEANGLFQEFISFGYKQEYEDGMWLSLKKELPKVKY